MEVAVYFVCLITVLNSTIRYSIANTLQETVLCKIFGKKFSDYLVDTV
jgi:hypothetical protein